MKTDGPFFDKEHLGVLESVFTFLDAGEFRCHPVLNAARAVTMATPTLWCRVVAACQTATAS